jgi:hypothetical protein
VEDKVKVVSQVRGKENRRNYLQGIKHSEMGRGHEREAREQMTDPQGDIAAPVLLRHERDNGVVLVQPVAVGQETGLGKNIVKIGKNGSNENGQYASISLHRA